MDLETLKEILQDKSPHIALAMIKKLSLAPDKSSLKVLVAVYPEEREMVATMTWEAVGPGSGIFQFPVPRDLVLIAYADKDPNQCFVIRRLTSREDKIPMQAVDGDTSVIALNGKKVWITSNQKIFFSAGETEPTEPVVLGTQLTTLLAAVLTKVGALAEKVSTHKHSGNLGFPTSPPMESADFMALKSFFDEKKSSPVEDGAILSKLTFTD